MPRKVWLSEGRRRNALAALMLLAAFTAGFGVAQIPADTVRDVATWAWRPDGVIRRGFGMTVEAVVFAVAAAVTTVTVTRISRWWRRRR